MQDAILILDFGSQYTQLIARRVRELQVYCEIHPFHHIPANWADFKAIILSGSPFSTLEEGAPHPDLTPMLGTLPIVRSVLWSAVLGQNPWWKGCALDPP